MEDDGRRGWSNPELFGGEGVGTMLKTASKAVVFGGPTDTQQFAAVSSDENTGDYHRPEYCHWSASLVLEFAKIFLSPAVPPESDIAFTGQELSTWAARVWYWLLGLVWVAWTGMGLWVACGYNNGVKWYQTSPLYSVVDRMKNGSAL